MLETEREGRKGGYWGGDERRCPAINIGEGRRCISSLRTGGVKLERKLTLGVLSKAYRGTEIVYIPTRSKHDCTYCILRTIYRVFVSVVLDDNYTEYDMIRQIKVFS